MPEPNLTERQQQILDVISAHLRRHGFAPTVRDVGDSIGLSSSATIQKHLDSLRRKGLLSWSHHRNRVLVPVEWTNAVHLSAEDATHLADLLDQALRCVPVDSLLGLRLCHWRTYLADPEAQEYEITPAGLSALATEEDDPEKLQELDAPEKGG